MRTLSHTWSKALSLGAVAATSFGGAAIFSYASDDKNNGSAVQAISPTTFTLFTLISRDRVSETSSILKFRVASRADTHARDVLGDLWRRGIWSVEVKQPQLMIARRYTPLSLPSHLNETVESKSNTTPTSPTPSNGQPDVDLSLLVRRESQGEVSRYLHAIPVGATLEVRGGYLEYALPEDVKEVVFLAGGTGIAPALQVARILQDRGAEAKMSVLWANRTREDCAGGFDTGTRVASSEPAAPGGWTRLWAGKQVIQSPEPVETKNSIVQQLDDLAPNTRAGDKNAKALHFETRYFVDEEGTLIRQDDIERTLNARTPDPSSNPHGRKVIIISGPDGFVEYLAGRKRLVGGIETQGPIGGLLSRADLRGWEVWKL